MKKSELIKKMNEGIDPSSLGFETVGDDGTNSLIIKKWGKGVMQLNRCETPDGIFYDDDIEGWYK